VDEGERMCILSVDASNAFNLLDRQATLTFIAERCPELYLAAYNTYGTSSYTTLLDEYCSVEQGTTQGCP